MATIGYRVILNLPYMAVKKMIWGMIEIFEHEDSSFELYTTI